MTDATDPAPPATTPAKKPWEYGREANELWDIINEMYRLAPSKLHPLLIVARSMLNANIEDGT